ncbi:MAG: phosphoribosylaminoimidazolesuccinocarboxamide synthase [Candidatus Dadabacteria bacterium]|nr:MAG: phosphoribosylaminoimidazolesuccinocarboxamide synthase [Candidatus Dadabacteria bacterium]
MAKKELIAEGKAKKIYSTDDPDLLIFYFKDDATAFNAQKRGTITAKGELNRQISARLFRLLEEKGIRTHFVSELGAREMVVRKLEIVPVETVVRNIIAGSLASRTGRPEGEELSRPIVEYYYKSDELGDPMINSEHAIVFGWATEGELDEIHRQALAVNDVLRPFFAERGILLVDFKLEFGRDATGKIVLGDEICPDTCRLWDAETHRKLDKDRFRRDLGGVEEAYQEIARRVAG